MTSIGERMRQVRIEHDLRQVFVSEHSGVGQDLLSRFENGERTPTYEHLERIAKIYRMTVIEFLGGFDDALSDDERKLIAALRGKDMACVLRLLASIAEAAT